MSQPWLDDLSEEWVVPVDSNAIIASSTKCPTSAQTSLNAPPKPRSRLPRLRQSSGSLSDVENRSFASSLRSTKRRSALIERSLSDNNILPSGADGSVVHRKHAPVAARDLLSEDFDGTVAQKSPAKSNSGDRCDHDTPEWRRRLLKGEAGYGDQKDLFGPSGLENIFQQPQSTKKNDAPPKSKLALFKNASNVPSSPPPWPRSLVEQPSLGRMVSLGTKGAAADNASGAAAQEQITLDNGSRVVSGRTEFDNENFSPVYLTTNHRIGSAATAEMPQFRGSELAERLRQIGTPASERVPAPAPAVIAPEGARDSSFAQSQEVSLPEDLPAGTPDCAHIGKFVEIKRGGYSSDDSFRTRPLSPSPQRIPLDSLRDEGDVSGSAAGVETSSPTNMKKHSQYLAPETPRTDKRPSLLGAQDRSSGSPLKLFGAHDTFTSKRLQRRLSQLELSPDKVGANPLASRGDRPQEKVRPLRELSPVADTSLSQLQPGQPHATDEKEAQAAGAFGKGRLNDFSFTGDFSIPTSQESEAWSSRPGSPAPSTQVVGRQSSIQFVYDASSLSQASSVVRRQGLTRVKIPSRTRVTSRSRRSSSPMFPDDLQDDQPEYAEGKRGPTSPFKNPAAKRRRTIHSISEAGMDSTQSSTQIHHDLHSALPSVIGRKRKDTRHASHATADPEVLARRHILRPRNPTPSQRRIDEMQAEIIEATEAFIHSSPKMTSIREHIEQDDDSEVSQEHARAVAQEVAAFSMRRQLHPRDEMRKKSVTTQDFLDEAVKIMNYIRGKGRPTSGLGSLEETEAESAFTPDERARDSSSLTFDRPPSREGRLSAWKEPNKRELDPQVISHLQRFQDRESDDVLGSSFRSLRLSPPEDVRTASGDSIVVEQDDIRITDDPNRHQSRDDASASQPATTQASTSSASLSSRTVATSTSKRSEHVATLAPETVAHLIPKEIAGMSFDPEKNAWVRQKSPIRGTGRHDEPSDSQDSEEDPFGHIPDLTVDETAERMLDRGSRNEQQSTSRAVQDQRLADDSRPTTREGGHTVGMETSSVPSKVSKFAWSYPKTEKTETRATSWAEQDLDAHGTQKMPRHVLASRISEASEDDIEHEIGYYEDRALSPPTLPRSHIRDITITIAEHEGADEGLPVENTASFPSRTLQKQRQQAQSLPLARKATLNNAFGAGLPQQSRTLPRAVLDEVGEVSFMEEAPGRYKMQVSMSVAAPSSHDNAPACIQSSPAKADITFMLSDLPDFTLHQADEVDRQDRVVLQRDAYGFSQALEDRYANGTADLVRALQDADSDEPFWEELRKVDLHAKALTSLHRLDAFCCRLEELDASENGICQLQGVPFTMRRLHLQGNGLTSLTSWTMLMNLQYLDISNNDIDGLDALGELVHLRVLKADGNRIASLTGVLHLDALLQLSVAENQLDTVDFSAATLHSLTDLDLRGNNMDDVKNLSRLPRLQHLDLDDNCIKSFSGADQGQAPCKELRSLRICGNGMGSIDLHGAVPTIESLFLDRNALASIDGLDDLRHLKTLSARDQMLSSEFKGDACVQQLFTNLDVHDIRLSLNPTRGLALSQHMLNLQRLEMASMGLKQLPQDLGVLLPNLRSLNINFNAISDLKPLLNIMRLSELLVAGNKLERLRSSATVLGKLRTLTKLDWRNNPLSLRFYAPISDNRVMSLRRKPSEVQEFDRFTLPPQDPEEDAQHVTRLDQETRIRRRVTEMMLANACKSLEDLDGLAFDKKIVMRRDDVWERLLALGVIKKQGCIGGEKGGQTALA